jgi:hypothetical protein
VDSFEDVHTDDFITAVGRVGRRQLRRLDLDPYPTGLLKRGLSKKVVEKGVSQEVLQGMEYTGAVGVMLSHDMANVNKRVDELTEVVERVGHETDELSGMRQEVMELGAELTEARGEAEECRGAMMLMRNALTDATREFQDFKAEWTEQREILIRICSGLLGRLEAVEGWWVLGRWVVRSSSRTRIVGTTGTWRPLRRIRSVRGRGRCLRRRTTLWSGIG